MLCCFYQVQILVQKQILKAKIDDAFQGETEPFKPFRHRYHVPYKASGSTEPFWYSVKIASAHIIVLASYSAYGNFFKHPFLLTCLKRFLLTLPFNVQVLRSVYNVQVLPVCFIYSHLLCTNVIFLLQVNILLNVNGLRQS